MARKTVNNNRSGISQLPNNKPVVYKIITKAGVTNYVGIAQRGRVQQRLLEHLSGSKDYIPGSKIQIEQMDCLGDCRQREANTILRTKPKHNKQGR